MKITKIALYLFWVSCFLVILSLVIKDKDLLIVSTTVTVPSIFFYYCNKVKHINYLFILSLFCFYLIDLIGLMRFENEIAYIFFPLLISYSVLIYFVIQDYQKIKFQTFEVCVSIFVLFLILILLFTILNLIDIDSYYLLISFLIIAFSLVFLCMMVLINTFTQNNFSNFYFSLSCFCYYFNNCFYAIQKTIIFLPVFVYLAVILKLVSYYFIVRYIIFRKTKPGFTILHNY